ncbi:GNAT family N-acetyltransferase, partial [Frankia sp. CNm7]|uniref:GNAT family N-acetyltransferase n=1 Tax=Frankia nepalensis TaxID=1836974 RepID=UPI0019330A19
IPRPTRYRDRGRAGRRTGARRPGRRAPRPGGGARRRGGGGGGGATAVLAALARWAVLAGARRAYLQVEQDNAAARRLYAGRGFLPVYRYTYRVLAPSGRLG